MDIEKLYSALQLPMVVMLAAMSLAMAMRARNAGRGEHTMPSAVVLWLLAAFFALWSIRLGWWSVRWALRALDLHVASEQMADRVLVPMITNVICIGIGSAILSIAAKPHLGLLAVPAVLTSVAAILAVGAILSGAI
jgi:hypothetical protein